MNFYLMHADKGLNTGQVGAAAAYALTGILDILIEIQDEHKADRIESERANRDGVWETQYFVRIDDRKPIYCEGGQQAACDVAREARKQVGPEAKIEVFWTEIKRYGATAMEPDDWLDPASDGESA